MHGRQKLLRKRVAQAMIIAFCWIQLPWVNLESAQTQPWRDSQSRIARTLNVKISPRQVLAGDKGRIAEMEQTIARVGTEIDKLERKILLAYWDFFHGGKVVLAPLQESVARLAEENLDAVRQVRQEAQDPDLRRQAGLTEQYLARALVDGNKEVAELMDRLNEIQSGFRIREAWNHMEDPSSTSEGRKKRFKETMEGVTDASEEILLELIRRRNKRAVELGFQDYATLALSTLELTPKELLEWIGRIEEATRADFKNWLSKREESLLAEYRDSGLREVYYWDFWLPTNEAEKKLREAISPRRISDLAQELARALGFDLSDRRFLVDSKEGRSPAIFPVEPGSKILILVPLSDQTKGIDHARTLAHEWVGHGSHFARIDPNLPVIYQRTENIGLAEGIAEFMESLMMKLEFLREHLPEVSAEDLESVVEQYLGRKLADLRRFAAFTEFEISLYQMKDPTSEKVRGLYERVWQRHLSRPSGDPEKPGGSWARNAQFIHNPMNQQNYWLGALIVPQLDAAAEARFRGSAIHKRMAQWLTDTIFKPGNSISWKTRLSAATGHQVNNLEDLTFLNVLPRGIPTPDEDLLQASL